MIKVSSWGKSIEGLFREYISVVGVLWGECHFFLLGGDGEFSREGGFTNVFAFKRDGLLFPVYVGIVLC